MNERHLEQRLKQEQERRRGVLYPQHLPQFNRITPPPKLIHAVAWFWIPEWNLPEGEESVQRILPFPSCNLVVETEGVTIVGPPTRQSERILTGRGWAVGALLRPAAAEQLLPNLAEMVDTVRPIEAPQLHGAVLSAMNATERDPAARRSDAAGALAEWISARVPALVHGSDGALANELAVAIADPSVVRVSDLETRLHASTRTLQRIAARFFGISPHSMIRRRRLQEAAERLRQDQGLPIARIATELGYADHAHFSSDFKSLLGVTPSAYRESAGSDG